MFPVFDPIGEASADITGEWTMVRFQYTAPANALPLPADLSQTEFTQDGLVFTQFLGPDRQVPGTVSGTVYTQTDGSFTATIDLDGDRGIGRFEQGDFHFNFELTREAPPAFNPAGDWSSTSGPEVYRVDGDGETVQVQVGDVLLSGSMDDAVALLAAGDPSADQSFGAVLELTSEDEATLTLHVADWQVDENGGHTGFTATDTTIELTRGGLPDDVGVDADVAPDVEPDVGPDVPNDTEPDAEEDSAPDVGPDVPDDRVCEEITFSGQIGGAADADGGMVRFEAFSEEYDSGFLDLLQSLPSFEEGSVHEGSWDFSAATVAATGYRGGAIDYAQRQFWLQDGRFYVSVYFDADDTVNPPPFDVRVGQRIEGRATHVQIFRGGLSIVAVDPTAWRLNSDNEEVHVQEIDSASVSDINRVVRASGRLTEVINEDCGGAAVCYEFEYGNGGVATLRSADPELAVGQCVTFVGPISGSPEDDLNPTLQPVFDSDNFDWVEVSCDGIPLANLVGTPCALRCSDPYDGGECDGIGPYGGTCTVAGQPRLECVPGGEGRPNSECHAQSDCESGLVCEDFRCLPLCSVSGDGPGCGTLGGCLPYITDELGVCKGECDGFAGAGQCPDGQGCVPGLTGGGSGSGVCEDVGTGGTGTPCSTAEDEHTCGELLACTRSTPSVEERCMQRCDPTTPDADSTCVGDGEICAGSGLGGVCVAGCDPSALVTGCEGVSGLERCRAISSDRGICAPQGFLADGAPCSWVEGDGYVDCMGYCRPNDSEDTSPTRAGTCTSVCEPFEEPLGAGPGDCEGGQICQVFNAVTGICVSAPTEVLSVFDECEPGVICDRNLQCFDTGPGSGGLCLAFCRVGEDDCEGYPSGADPTGCLEVLGVSGLGVCLP